MLCYPKWVQERTSPLEPWREFGFEDLAFLGIIFSVVRQFGLLGEKSTMSKDAQKQVVLTEEAKKKFEECVAACAACGFGVDGPPMDTTFAEIEGFGHEIGRMVARAIGERLTSQHAAHFQAATPCPSCGSVCSPKEAPAKRGLKTKDGDVPLEEPVFRCPVCDRDFFPSTRGVEN